MSADTGRDLVGRSLLVRAASGAIDRLSAAAGSSAVAACGRRVRGEIEALAPVSRIRLAAIVVLTAIVTCETLQTLVPPHARPALPLAFGLFIGALAVTVLVAAPHVVRAWPHSRLRRACARVRTAK